MEWKPEHPAFQRLLRAFLQQVPTVYVVGGVVRDHLLREQAQQTQTTKQNPLTDLDLAVDHPTLPVARQVADELGWAFYPLDETRDVARLVFTANTAEPLVCDVARIRDGTLDNDLRLRDFTINAMAFAIKRFGEATLVDRFGGQHDLAQQQIRRVSAASLADDPVRSLRAIRLMVQFGFQLDEETRLQIKQICSTVTLASAERIRDELWKMLSSDEPDKAITELRKLSLLTHVLPEVDHMSGVEQSYPHFEDVFQHSLRTMQNAVQLRNWILGKETIQSSHFGISEAMQPGTTAAADMTTMAPWTTLLAPHQTALRKHFRVPIAAGRTRADWLVWLAMLHDIGKPETRTAEEQPNGSVRYRFFNHEEVGAQMAEERLQRLRFSRQETTLVRRVITYHMRPHLLSSSFVGEPISRRAKFRFFRDTQGNAQTQQSRPQETLATNRNAQKSATLDKTVGYFANDGIDTLTLALADYQAIHQRLPKSIEPYWVHSKELFDYIFDPDGFNATEQQPLLDGKTLMQALALKPGPVIGHLLTMIQEAQAAGEITSKEDALLLAADYMQDAVATAPISEYLS